MITVNTNGQALSQAFVDALTDPALRYNAKLFMNGVELNGLIDSVTITEGSCGDEGAFSVGSVVGSTMVAVVADLRDIVKGQEIEVHIGVMTDAEAETYEYVRMGYFNVSACPRNANKTTITAYGRTVTKTACAFTPPATKTIANIVANIKSDIQAAYGINVPITVSGVPTSTTIGGTLEGLTCYQVLQILASAVGGYATDTPDGGIVIKKLTNTVSLSTNTDRMVMLPVVEENDFEITGVTCSVSEEVEVEVDKAFPGSNLQRYGAARGETYTDSVTVTLAQGYRTGGEEFFYAGSSTVNILDIETQEWDKSEDTFEATFVWGTSSEEVIIDHDDGDVVLTAKLVYNAAANTMTLALNGTVSNEYYAQWGAACGSARYSSEVHPAVSYTYGTPVTLTVENPYMTQSLFDSGLKTLVGYRYRPGTASLTYGDPRLEGTDVVEITDITGEVYSLPCHALVHSYTGGLTSTITAAVATFEENDISTALPITAGIADVASSALAAKVSADAAASSAESANQSALSAAAAAAGAGESAQYAAAQAVAADQEAKRAKAAAETASGQAQIATRSANGALNGLSTVQDVIGVLDWAQKNATYTLTSDTDIVPGKTYWTRSGSGTEADPYVYNPVVTPVKADLGTYYEISGVDEAMADFINTHLALTDEGLYVLGGANQWKVLIAPDGVYIINDTGNEVAKYKDVITLGMDDGTESYQRLDYHSLQLIGRGESTPYFWVSDLRDKNDDYMATITETFRGDGSNKSFSVSLSVNAEVSATDSSHSTNTATRANKTYTFDTAPSNGATITIVYKTKSEYAKAYTFGKRGSGPVGAMSFAEGSGVVASGEASHAEGSHSTASGKYSHAEGSGVARGEGSHAEGDGVASGLGSHAEGAQTEAYGILSHAEGYATVADGAGSHAQNWGTKATYNYQTAIGKYNRNQDNAFEIGNGTSDSDRSNAFSVGWDGNAKMCLNKYQTSGNVDKTIYDALNSLGWLSDCTES